MENPKFIICDCYCHTLYLDKDNEYGEINIALFHRGLKGDIFNWKQRIKRAWDILIRGTPYTDELILNREKSLELKKWINKNIK